jgi:hypothetical protein
MQINNQSPDDQFVAGVTAGLADAFAQPSETPTDDEGSTVERETPDPAIQRAALVERVCASVREAREHWTKKAFKQMRLDMSFAAGNQWDQDSNPDTLADPVGGRYVANIVIRHIQQRTATLYGKNPRFVARRREKLLSTVWDGSMVSLQQAMMQAQNMMAVGLPPDPMTQAVIMDAQAVMETGRKMTRISKTLELLFQYEVDEQVIPFKTQMKSTIRRSLTTGVGYVKLGYQRLMGKRPETEQAIADLSQRLATIERLSADLADGIKTQDSAEAEELRLAMQTLAATNDMVVREGLAVFYPDSTAIIPDKNCKQLRGFVGCEWVAEEYYLSRESIEEIYNVDVGTSATMYVECAGGEFKPGERTEGAEQSDGLFCVWEVYNRKTGTVCTVCDGYKDFLQEPAEPDVYLERFWPWFPLVFNEIYYDNNPFPPSDVFLLRNPQLEINRARQGLREHRRAARPKTFARQGILEESDKDKLRTSVANEVIELAGLQPNEKIEAVLQPYTGPQIDPRLYDTVPAMEDILRVVGQQEANLGGTSGSTATESSIAEGSRLSSVSSAIDDLDEFLTDFARAGGQVLFRETQPETVREVCGPGAMWPDIAESRTEIAKELYLDIEAASSGRPNKAQEVQNAQQIFPLLMQIPGLSPEWMARELLRRMDDRLDLTDAFASGMPSIQMLNGMSGDPGGEPPDKDPKAQGKEGSNNQPSTQPKQVNAAPRPQQAPQSAQAGMAGGMTAGRPPGRPPMGPAPDRPPGG